MHLEIDRTNIRSARLVESAPPDDLADEIGRAHV
jgi:hypothetical protein